VAGAAINQLAQPEDALQTKTSFTPLASSQTAEAQSRSTKGWFRHNAKEQVISFIRKNLSMFSELVQSEVGSTNAAAHRLAERRLQKDKMDDTR
jgi:hypothetical protein